jgi:SanA protein
MRVRRFLRFALRYGAVGVLIGVFYANTVISNVSDQYIYSQLDDVPASRVGVVLGTSPRLATGEPNPYFTHRMDAAAQLYRGGKVEYLLASGDFRRSNYNETAAMRRALMARGVPSRAIYLDNRGLNTFDSVMRAHLVYGLERFLVISQKFHAERAIYIGRSFGIDLEGYSARAVEGTVSLRTSIREYFARAKALLDVAILQRRPDFGNASLRIP